MGRQNEYPTPNTGENNMKIPSAVYDFLKWILLIVVPAFLTFFPTLCKAWGWEIPVDAIMTTISATATFLGVILGISTINYNKEQQK